MQDYSQSVLGMLLASTAYHNSSVSIEWGDRQGILHLRNGLIVAAEAEPLSGNGAAMEIVRWQGFSVSEIEAETVIKKNVTLSLKDMETWLGRLSLGPLAEPAFDDFAALDQAVLLIHQFKYAEAGTILADLLRHNRFNYLGWLWYSRLLKKISSIKKALDEAQKWGDHDPDVWLEVKKTGVGIANSDGGESKRCLFCWTPLNVGDTKCCYCKALQSIRQPPPVVDLKKIELVKAINRYVAALREDRVNTKAGYAVALAFYNLRQFDKAVKYLEYIDKISPDKPTYRAALKMLESFSTKTHQRTEADRLKAVQPAAPTPKPSPSVNPGQSLILVVEDSPTARKVVKLVLKREGFAVAEAASGEQAIEVAENINPGLILLDVMLPDMTGYDVLPRLREFDHLAETPVVMLTGRKGSMDRMKGILAGSAEYLTKPFDPQKLTSVIKKYV